MKKVYKNLYIGSIDDFHSLDPKSKDWAFVHATKTVHYNVFGKDLTYNKEERSYDDYLYYAEDNRLSLNWMDGPAIFYEPGGIKVFEEALDFIDKWITERKVLVHCDQGVSRSPTLTLTYLAKRTDKLPNNSFEKAKDKFIKIYPDYFPGGIKEYVSNNWDKIDN